MFSKYSVRNVFSKYSVRNVFSKCSVRNVSYYLFHGRDTPFHFFFLLNRNFLNIALNDNSPSWAFTRLQNTFRLDLDFVDYKTLSRLQSTFREVQFDNQNAYGRNVKCKKFSFRF